MNTRMSITMRYSILILITISFVLVTTCFAGDDDDKYEYGGYVSKAEDRFKDYVWEFLDELGHNCGGLSCADYTSSSIHKYFRKAQYYWGECRMLLSQSLSYVDSVDVAYLAGHGSPSSIRINPDEAACNLTRASWGGYAANGKSTKGHGDLEAIVFHSCQVLKMNDGWRSRWKQQKKYEVKPFSGLHHAMGFRTNHANDLGAGTWTADEFAENLEEKMSFRSAWLEAVADGYVLAPISVGVEGKNRGAVFFIRPHKDENMHDIRELGSLDYHYPDADYLLDARYHE